MCLQKTRKKTKKPKTKNEKPNQSEPNPGDQSATEIDKVSQCQGDTEEET